MDKAVEMAIHKEEEKMMTRNDASDDDGSKYLKFM